MECSIKNQLKSLLQKLLDKVAEDGYLLKEPNRHVNKTDASKFRFSVKLEAYEFKKKGGYKRKARKDKWDSFWKKTENLPKRYWFVGALLVSQVYNLKDLSTDVLKALKHLSKIESSKKSPQQDTSRNHPAF